MNPKQLGSGRWQVRFPLPDRRRQTFLTKREADSALMKAKLARNAGVYQSAQACPTFGTVAADWLREKANFKPSSVESWEHHVNMHLESLHLLPVNKITVATIEALRDDLGTRIAPPTINKILVTGAAIFDRAIRHGHVTTNPAAAKTGAARARKALVQVTGDSNEDSNLNGNSSDILSADEIQRLLASASDFYRPLLTVAALTGLRSGELLALRWSDIDLDGNQLHVKRSLTWAGGGGARFFTPKTRSSIRVFPLAPELVLMLKQWKLACPVGELVFPTETGKPLHRATLMRHGLDPALKRAHLRHIGLHSLRHSFASMLIANGSPITEVAALLGHASPAITLRVYSHFLKDQRTDATARLATAILGKGLTAKQA